MTQNKKSSKLKVFKMLLLIIIASMMGFNKTSFLLSQSSSAEITGIWVVSVDGKSVTINGAAKNMKGKAHWGWGDGKKDDQYFPAIHTYEQSGSYAVTVTAYGYDGSYDSKSIDVTISQQKSPVEITGLWVVSVDGKSVTIDGAAKNIKGKAHWGWGDGKENDRYFPATHTYEQSGSYAVTVTAYGYDGSYDSKSIDVTISQQKSPVEITGLGSVTIDGLKVKINGGARNMEGEAQWNWGDGHEDAQYFPGSHSYEKNGTYTVLVTVYGYDGTIDIKGINITISPDHINRNDKSSVGNPADLINFLTDILFCFLMHEESSQYEQGYDQGQSVAQETVLKMARAYGSLDKEIYNKYDFSKWESSLFSKTHHDVYNYVCNKYGYGYCIWERDRYSDGYVDGYNSALDEISRDEVIEAYEEGFIDEDNDGRINLFEILDIIDLWKLGHISLNTVISAINIWSQCELP
jgi:PKD repeat protein